MIAIDTNILVYAHREVSEWHEAASTRVAELAEGRGAWAIPWPCIHEFPAIASHPKILPRLHKIVFPDSLDEDEAARL